MHPSNPHQGRHINLLRFVALIVALAVTLPACARLTADKIIQHGERPEGVVFEIIEGDEEDLVWALQQVANDAKALRAKFPDLEIAVVTHGREQFALTKDNKENFGNLHALGESLVQDENIPLHVCATHASWYDVVPEDFPDFVDSAPTGPGQVRQYQELGYELIVVEKR